MSHTLLILVVLLNISRSLNGLYFYISETERKCFIEELPEETPVVGHYKCELVDPKTDGVAFSHPSIGIHVEVLDPEDEVILSELYTLEGRFTFTSSSPGEHTICLYSNSSKWFSGSQLRVHLDIRIGGYAIEYAVVSHKEKLTDMELRVRQLLDQAKQIRREQEYQSYREQVFRQKSENTNKKVMWCALGQTVILVIMGLWQMRNLKTFFQAKKLV